MPAALRQPRQDRHEQAGEFTGFVLRLLLGLMGASLTLASFGLWLVPGDGDAPSLSLMKLGVSLFMLISGLCCLVISRAQR